MLNNFKKKQVLKPFVSIILISVLLINASSFAVGAVIDDYNSNYNKMDTILQEKIQELSDNEKIGVSVWINDIGKDILQNNVQRALQSYLKSGEISQFVINDVLNTEQNNCNFNSTSMELINEDYSDVSSEDVDLAIHTERAEARLLHEENNITAYNELFPSENDQPEIVYMSKYAPNIELMLNKSEILNIMQSEKVESLYYVNPYAEVFNDDYYNDEADNSVDSEDDEDGSYDTSYFSACGLQQGKDVWSLNGNGIKVGMIDAKSPSVGVLENSSVTILNDNISVDLHATSVASIMVGNVDNYKGAIPMAQLYAFAANQEYLIRSALDTLVGCDVSVINASLSFGYNYNEYGDISRYYDYISFNHNVVLVLSSSNTGTTGVPTTNMSYNAIVVGNCDNSGTWYSSSSYSSNADVAYKPDIVAPGVDIRTFVYKDTGTSYSAPMVTSAVAQLMQSNSALKAKPNLIKAVLLSGSKITDSMSSSFNYSNTGDNSISWSRKYGAGMLNLVNSYNLVNNYGYYKCTTTSPYSSAAEFTKQVRVSGEKTMRVCLAWDKVLEKNSNSLQEYDLDNFSLTVTTPSGISYTSQCLNDNKQMVSFKTSEGGTYTFKLKRIDGSNSNHVVNYAIAFSVQ